MIKATVSNSSSTFNVSVGPAGRALAEPIDNDLLEAFHKHLTMERNSSAQYFAISLWFLERELRGFAEFFKQESQSEQEHASKFAEYLIARGHQNILEELPSPIQEWNSIEEIISASFLMESDVSTSLNQLYSLAERNSDTRSTVFLDPIVENQISSEDEFAYLLGRVKFSANQPSALLIIDTELIAK